jgi:hypothetical protein
VNLKGKHSVLIALVQLGRKSFSFGPGVHLPQKQKAAFLKGKRLYKRTYILNSLS